MIKVIFSFEDSLVLVSVCYTGSDHCGIRRGVRAWQKILTRDVSPYFWD